MEQPSWIAPEDNPWGVRLLDLRPWTRGWIATSSDPDCALTLTQMMHEDGQRLADAPLPGPLRPAHLRYPLDGDVLLDGPLFNPREMEHKWAVYHYGGRILCLRSWTAAVTLVAETHDEDRHLVIDAVAGDEPPGGLDFLLRTHALEERWVLPMLSDEPETCARAAFSCYGSLAEFATPDPLPHFPPRTPLRTNSLLHIAVARGDVAEALALVDRLGCRHLAKDGLTLMHWATVNDGTVKALLEAGVPADLRSAGGTTALMSATEKGGLETLRLLLAGGADPGAADDRGFTCLHRAAELGQGEILEALLAAGAPAHPEAHGHTPLSLARLRGHDDLARRLEAAPRP